MRCTDGGIEQAQVVVDFGDRPHGGAGAAGGGPLFNGDRGAEAVDGIHVRTFHLVQELPRVGGERLHVTALAFGVDGVERQRGLARAAQTRDHGEAIARDFHVNVLEIVLARPVDRDLIDGHRK